MSTTTVSWSHPSRGCEPGWLNTPSSYHIQVNSARALKGVEGVIKTGAKKAVTDRRFWPWAVYMLERQGLQDMIGFGRPFLLYARSGDPAHAAGVAHELWKQIYRSGKSDFDPWPDIDATVTVERVDDRDFEVLMREALSPKRIDAFCYGGHHKDPWIWHTRDQDMSIRILDHLKQRGPTFGGVIFQDPHPAIGGLGIEKEADLSIEESGDFI